jgi:hypothetical protein
MDAVELRRVVEAACAALHAADQPFSTRTLRQQLEREAGLPAGALDPRTGEIRAFVDAWLEATLEAEAAAAAAAAPAASRWGGTTVGWPGTRTTSCTRPCARSGSRQRGEQ